MAEAKPPRDARKMTRQEYRAAVDDIIRTDAAAREAAENERVMNRLRRKYPEIAARAAAASREG